MRLDYLPILGLHHIAPAAVKDPGLPQLRGRGTHPTVDAVPGGFDGYHSDQKSSIVDYPIMPAYNQPYSHHQVPGYPQYNSSVPTIHDERYDDETGSQVHLTSAAALIPRGESADPHYGYVADHYNLYYTNDQKDYPQPTRTPAPVYDPNPQDSYAHTQRDAHGGDSYYQQPGYGQGQPHQRGGGDGGNGYGRAV